MGDLRWDLPLIMCCFSFCIAERKNEMLGESSFTSQRVLVSPIGLAMGWSSDCSHHVFLINFCRETNCRTGWVFLLKFKKKKRGGSACVSCGMKCSCHHPLLFPFFSTRTNWRMGWVFYPELKEYGVSHEMTSCPTSSCILFLFLSQQQNLKNQVSLPQTKAMWGFWWDNKLSHLIMCYFSSFSSGWN